MIALHKYLEPGRTVWYKKSQWIVVGYIGYDLAYLISIRKNPIITDAVAMINDVSVTPTEELC